MDSQTMNFLFTLITMITTIIGWLYVARKQKELLDRQIESENLRTKMHFSIPRKLDQIDKIIQWRSEGNSVFRFITSQNDFNEAKRKFVDWEEKFWSEIYEVAHLLDPRSNKDDHERDELPYLLLGEWFHSKALLNSMSAQNSDASNVHQLENANLAKRVNERIHKIHSEIIG